MISDIIYSKGKDNFKDDSFSEREWSAPIYHEIHGRKNPYLTVRVDNKNNYKEGLITCDGKTVIEAEHDRIGWYSDYKHFFCCSEGCCEMYVVEDLPAMPLRLCRNKGRKWQF